MRIIARFQTAACLLIAAMTSLVAQAQTAPRPAIAESINEKSLVTIQGSVSPLTKTSRDKGSAPDTLELGRTMLLLKRSPEQQQALDALIAAQQNSKSSSYHKWLTPSRFGAQYGAAQQDVDTITAWLQSYGLQVEPPVPGRNVLIFSGTHAQLKAAFHTELHSYEREGKSYWSNAVEPQVPAALKPAIAGFVSLNNFPRHALHTQPKALRRQGAEWVASSNAAGLSPDDTVNISGTTFFALAPYDLATIYNLKPLWDAGIDGTGQTIAIVGDSDFNPADVDYFRSVFGLPAKKLNVIYPSTKPVTTMDESEVALDVEWAGAVARNATIDAVLAPNTNTSAGIDEAAIYVINNNIASILNVSYGECEPYLGSAGNQFYSELWEQAAAEGITVTTATGDSGSAGCDAASSSNNVATSGLQVSGIASTPYNVAVGGTDLYGNYLNAKKYWSKTNDPTTYQSALSYVPEIPWNNSCANPQILAALQAQGVSDTTEEALCNDPNEQAGTLFTVGGGGGASNCATLDPTTGECQAGYPKPAWQSGLAGVPADGVRDLPDVSFMAGSGTWGSFYIYCQSDATTNGQCDVNQEIQGAGGTSFASPVFAGVMALVGQATSSAQGNPNYILYKMAESQFTGSQAASCSSSSAASGNACIFYDIDSGSNSVPCIGGTPNCSPDDPNDSFGVLPGYTATTGYDLASGIGSINISNMVNGWQSTAASFLPSSTTLTTDTSAIVYGGALNVAVTVSAVSPATGSPTGDVSILGDSAASNGKPFAYATLTDGQTSGAVNFLPGGSYQLIARYTGDINFAASQSLGTAVTVTPFPVTGLSLYASQATITAGQNVTLSVTVPGIANGAAPTGSATFTDATSGKTLGTARLSTINGATSSVALLTVASSQLAGGPNSLTAAYSGDANYSAANTSSTSVAVAAPFAIAINPSSLILAPNATGSVTVTATPSGSATLNPAAISFSCPTALPTGLSCLFSTPKAGTNGTVVSTLSFQSTSPLAKPQRTVAMKNDQHPGWLLQGSIASLAGLFFIRARRRRSGHIILSTILAIFLGVLIGCGGGGTKAQPSLIATKTTLTTSPTSAALNAPVTLTAQISAASGTGSPSGSVTFYAGSTSLGSANLSGGSASLISSALKVGPQTLTGSYSGDSVYAASTSQGSVVDVIFTTTLAITASDSQGDASSANLALTIQ